jgi:hypothetical protein
MPQNLKNNDFFFVHDFLFIYTVFNFQTILMNNLILLFLYSNLKIIISII